MVSSIDIARHAEQDRKAREKAAEEAAAAQALVEQEAVGTEVVLAALAALAVELALPVALKTT